jgi:serine/threonine protein kinase HipA of HipAB toxin-antitoxin module
MKSTGLGLIIIGAKELRFESSHREARVATARIDGFSQSVIQGTSTATTSE